MPGSLSHLVARFFDALAARPLGDSEREAVGRLLSAEAAEVFFAQPVIDQRHGYHASRVVTAAGVEDPEVVAAALLHDVGKRHARLGVLGRSAASVLIRLGLPLGERVRVYRDHGETAAVELERLGLHPLVADFARHHHSSRPEAISEATWELLKRADRPAKTRWPLRAGIT